MYFYEQLADTLDLIGVPVHYENLEDITTSKYGVRPPKEGSGKSGRPECTASAMVTNHPDIFVRVSPGMIALKKWPTPPDGWSGYRVDKSGKLIKW